MRWVLGNIKWNVFIVPIMDKESKFSSKCFNQKFGVANLSRVARFSLVPLILFLAAGCKRETAGNPAQVSELIAMARRGNTVAQAELGMSLVKFGTTKVDQLQGLEWLKRAAGAGNAPAQVDLGTLYLKGGIVEADENIAFRWFSAAADQRNCYGQLQLGRCYFQGIGVERDTRKAIALFRKAADQNLSAAQLLVGSCYEEGLGVTKNLDEAAEWYRRAAEAGEPHAQNKIGEFYDRGLGLEVNHAEAVRWFQKASDQGHPESQFRLGVSNETGVGVATNIVEAMDQYQRAAIQGYAKAAFNLAMIYSRNEQFKDSSKAMFWFRKAADGGYIDAKINLGIASLRGIGTPVDCAAAVEWLSAAAKSGRHDAASLLGEAYAVCEPDNSDPALFSLIQKSAASGYTSAQTNLAFRYFKGIGCVEDIREGYKWLMVAARQDDDVDVTNIIRVYGLRLTDADIKEGAARARVVLDLQK